MRSSSVMDRANAPSLAIIAAASLILAISLLHAGVYGDRDYRNDELWTLRLAVISGPVGVVQTAAATDTQPPGWLLLADAWVHAFGISETVTRWLPRLTNLLAFALLYQLGKHIGGRQLGLLAICLLGSYGFASSYMNELRPYPMLIMLAVALHLIFYRWLQKPSSRLMFAYVFTGIAALYTHYFGMFIFAGHALCLPLFTRYQRKHWLDSLLMWLFIGLSFLGWLLPFLHATTVLMPGGIYYAIQRNWAGILHFYRETRFEPELLFQLLMVIGIFAPQTPGIPPSPAIRQRFMRLYPLVLLVVTLGIAYAADGLARSLSARNLVMFTPLIALCMAQGLRQLPGRAIFVILLLLGLHAPKHIERQTDQGPYRAIINSMSSSYMNDSLVLTEFETAWYWLLPAAYYLNDFTPDKMSKERIVHLVSPDDSAHPPTYPDPLVNIHKHFDDAAFEAALPPHQQLWHLRQGNGNQHGVALQSWLDSHYAHVRSVDWDEGYKTSYSLSEYVRAPAHSGPMLALGDSLRLYHWDLLASHNARPCESIEIESWWQLNAPDALPYTISFILAADEGGQLAIANTVPADEFTSDWQAKKFYRDRTALKIPCEIEAGRYNLLLAGKQSVSGAPLPLADAQGDRLGREVYLTTLTVADEA